MKDFLWIIRIIIIVMLAAKYVNNATALIAVLIVMMDIISIKPNA